LFIFRSCLVSVSRRSFYWTRLGDAHSEFGSPAVRQQGAEGGHRSRVRAGSLHGSTQNRQAPKSCVAFFRMWHTDRMLNFRHKRVWCMCVGCDYQYDTASPVGAVRRG
jgi:hypothetical protein